MRRLLSILILACLLIPAAVRAEIRILLPTRPPATEAPAETSAPEIRIGDTVTFGRYPQDLTGEAAPVRWTVLDIRDGGALLLSESCLDFMSYHEKGRKLAWKDCTLRSHLNSSFLREAFTIAERGAILPAQTDKDVTDSVFILSTEEFKTYEQRIRACDHVDLGSYALDVWRTTPYADAKNADSHFVMLLRGVSSCATVRYYDDVYASGQQPLHYKGYIRPAIWVSLEALTRRNNP